MLDATTTKLSRSPAANHCTPPLAAHAVLGLLPAAAPLAWMSTSCEAAASSPQRLPDNLPDKPASNSSRGLAGLLVEVTVPALPAWTFEGTKRPSTDPGRLRALNDTSWSAMAHVPSATQVPADAPAPLLAHAWNVFELPS